jgi:hypothetical protein
MQADHATGSRESEALEGPEPFAPDEPPHAEAAKVSPVTPTSASARTARALTSTMAISPWYDMGGCSTVTASARAGQS